MDGLSGGKEAVDAEGNKLPKKKQKQKSGGEGATEVKRGL